MHAVAVEDSRLLHGIPAARVALIERIARSAGTRRGPPATLAALPAQLLPRRRGGGPGGAQAPGAVARRAGASAVCHAPSAGRSLVRVFNPAARAPTASSARTRSCSRSPTTCPSWSTPSAWPSPAPSWPCTSSCTRCCRCDATAHGRLLDIGANGGRARRTRSPGSSTRSTASPIRRNCTSCSRTWRPRSPTCASRCATGCRCASACATLISEPGDQPATAAARRR